MDSETNDDLELGFCFAFAEPSLAPFLSDDFFAKASFSSSASLSDGNDELDDDVCFALFKRSDLTSASFTFPSEPIAMLSTSLPVTLLVTLLDTLVDTLLESLLGSLFLRLP